MCNRGRSIGMSFATLAHTSCTMDCLLSASPFVSNVQSPPLICRIICRASGHFVQTFRSYCNLHERLRQQSSVSKTDETTEEKGMPKPRHERSKWGLSLARIICIGKKSLCMGVECNTHLDQPHSDCA
ncbi:hypothetical protein EJ04DRAFT_341028 [Polyplosphaeria fusca]|uniref:Uncharacterized protein n=1 Tax=Polyplosphaeria fusca TaxID=682080 RepID=A0A9P4QWM7_9PLEO|nr:hypothetical protein EJ04DRAFT_341028 [Polyplosphaeria fusca]